MAGREQIRQSAQEMLRPENGGVRRGQYFGAVQALDIKIMVNWLADTPIGIFDSPDIKEPAQAEVYFKAVADEKSRAIRAGEISKDTELRTVIFVQNPNDPKQIENAAAVARAAVQNGIKVQFEVADAAALNALKDVIAGVNATVVVKDKATAQAALDAKLGAIGVACPTYDKDGNIPRFNQGTRANVVGFEALLEMVQNATDKTINTPEGQFNAGAREGEAEWYNKLNDVKAANEYIGDERNIAELTDAKSKAATGTLKDIMAYSRLRAMAGAALLISLTDGKITQNDMANHIPLRNLLAAFIMTKGAKVEDLRKVLNAQNEPAPKDINGAAYKLWALLKNPNTTVANVAGSIQVNFERPAMTLGEEFDLEYLTLAARALLDPLFSDMKKFDPAKEFGNSLKPNAQYFAAIFKAG
jgi:hypothetical protein